MKKILLVLSVVSLMAMVGCNRDRGETDSAVGTGTDMQREEIGTERDALGTDVDSFDTEGSRDLQQEEAMDYDTDDRLIDEPVRDIESDNN